VIVVNSVKSMWARLASVHRNDATFARINIQKNSCYDKLGDKQQNNDLTRRSGLVEALNQIE